MIVQVEYAAPSALRADREAAALGFSANARRPVRFRGRVRANGFVLRVALRALGEAIWSDDTWAAHTEILDPVITVHPDRLFFEAFSQDQSTYAALIVDPENFEQTEPPTPGTTNIDFSAWLWGALGELRSSRATTFEIGAGGMLVETRTAGGRFEKKVKLPDSWVRGFLQVQAAMAMPGTRIRARAVDLLSAIRYMRYSKARVSPRALRYEFVPGEDTRLVLEPWEHVVPLRDATHNYTEPKTTRVWGRRRLKLIEGLLPFAESVDIYLKGRALPSFYAVKLPGMTFLLGMTGWSGAAFTGSGGFDAIAEAAATDDAGLHPALAHLREHHHASVDEIATAVGVDRPRAAALLVRLCRQGRCMYDVEARRYRHRELFEKPIDERAFFPPDLRREEADRFLREHAVQIENCLAEETKKTRNLKTPEGRVTREITYRDWRVTGTVAGTGPVEAVVSDSGRLIFGRCTCAFFEEHLMNQGPCAHLQALFRASAAQRRDHPSSVAGRAEAAGPRQIRPNRWELDEVSSGEESDEDEEA